MLNRDGSAFTSRTRNLVSVLHDGEQFSHAIIIRDCRCNQVSKKGEEYLRDFQRRKGTYLSINIDEYAFLNALYDTLVAIEEQNLSIGTYKLSKGDFVQYLRSSGIARKSQLFRTAAKLATCFEDLFNPASVAAEEPRALDFPYRLQCNQNLLFWTCEKT